MKGLIRLISKLWLIGLPFVFLWGVYYVFFDEVTKEVAIFLTIYFIIGGFLFGKSAPYKNTMYDGVSPTLDNLIFPNNILRYDNNNN